MLRQYPDAARAYQRALTFRPDLVAADFNLGVIFGELGNRDAAIHAFSNVLERDPSHVMAHRNLGDTLFAAGRFDEWRANFARFEQHCPTALSLAVHALEVSQWIADFARVDRYLDGLRNDFRGRRPPAACRGAGGTAVPAALLRCRARDVRTHCGALRPDGQSASTGRRVACRRRVVRAGYASGTCRRICAIT